jgi:arsenate reductase-like glutaredoxin family protein
VRLGGPEALQLLDGMTKLLVAKGKKVTHIDLKKERPDDEALIKMMLGPTGNLRAPTLKVGKTVLVGFNPEAFTVTFGG